MGVDPVKVTFNCTNSNGKTVKQDIYIQPGINFDFGGKTYKVEKRGAVSGGNLIQEISVSREKLDALMAISQMNNEDNLPGNSKAFVLSEKDISKCFKGCYNNENETLNFKTNQRFHLDGHNLNAKWEWDTENPNTGEVTVHFSTGREGGLEEVSVSSNKSRTDAAAKVKKDEESEFHWSDLWPGNWKIFK